MSEQTPVDLEKISGSVWVGHDCKKYERTLEDGEIVDIHVGYECPCCRDEDFVSRDFFLEHLQMHHSAAQVYTAVVE